MFVGFFDLIYKTENDILIVNKYLYWNWIACVRAIINAYGGSKLEVSVKLNINVGRSQVKIFRILNRGHESTSMSLDASFSMTKFHYRQKCSKFSVTGQ